MKTTTGREQALRHEFHQQKQKHGGIRNYAVWLEKKLIETERQNVMLDMAAQKNFELWQSAESRIEDLIWGGE